VSEHRWSGAASDKNDLTLIQKHRFQRKSTSPGLLAGRPACLVRPSTHLKSALDWRGGQSALQSA
jgi:hypothetical protein